MIGIVIGISSVVTIMALGQGVKVQTLKSLQVSESGNQSTTIQYSGEENKSGFTADDLALINDQKNSNITKVTLVKKYDNLTLPMTIGAKDESTTVTFVSKDPKVNLVAGRQINQSDNDAFAPVVMISDKVAKKQFHDAKTALGNPVTIDGHSYTIIGVFHSDITDVKYGVSVLAPKKTYLANTNSSQGNEIKLTFKPKTNVAKKTHQVVDMLNKQGSGRKTGHYDYFDMGEILKGIGTAISGITIFIAAIAGISLFIAGIGVMNMMYISVSERTQEIGIRLAIGATPQNVLWQFLLEALMLTVSGGLIGFGIGAGLAFLISMALPFTAIVTVGSFALSVGVSTLVGIVFGLLPAKQAANKNLIEILR
jgi:putative ABC transport system permease protein